MNLIPCPLISTIPPESVINSNYYDIDQLQTLKEFTYKSGLSLFHMNTCSLILNTLFSQQRLILRLQLFLNQE